MTTLVPTAVPPLANAPAPARLRRRLTVRGLVQGVGFRPFVYVSACELGLAGTVANDPDGVVIDAEGSAAQLDALARRLTERAPPLAVVESVQASELPVSGQLGFRIVESVHRDGGRTLASVDVATCADCLRELADVDDRRYRHPFITCTNCGPRFTIITGLPYDRPSTTMADFPMCASCRSEYDDPADRRFHAQPIACPDCGPRLELTDARGTLHGDQQALAGARARLSGGAILAVKGIGGYHLVCDAVNEAAVSELRRRKQRGNKPFAVMVAGLASARRVVTMDAVEERLLGDPRRPVVLLPRSRNPTLEVARGVAPDTGELGVLLPYSGLHTLLLGLPGDDPGPSALVMTSANRGGEPIVTDDDDALQRLRPLVDGWLTHRRRIHVPCDDSVARVVAGAELPIRRSRGYAPMPITLPFEVPPLLAVGADLKNTCGVAEGRRFWFSQHIGDMDDLATLRAFAATERQLEELTGVHPTMLVHDDHPGYRSTSWALTHAAGRPVATVQHHHAHIAAVMAEHGLDGSSPVIGFAFDGTGFGPGQAIWGGEVLVADYLGFRRFAHLVEVPLAGGDVSVERPYRMALSFLRAAGVPWSDRLPPVAACPPEERRVLAHQLDTGFGCVPTSSMGRLFDAVASLTGVRHTAAYEAEAAMVLEAACRGAVATGRYRFGVVVAPPAAVGIDPAPVVAAVVRDVAAGLPVALIAAEFHGAVADAMVTVAELARGGSSAGRRLSTVALGGGVFQNARLLRSAAAGLRAAGFDVLVPQRVPPNDGGIALGQAVVAGARCRAGDAAAKPETADEQGPEAYN